MYKRQVSPEYEISIVKKGAEVRYLQVFRKKILWDGEIQWQVIYLDITEQKRMQKSLQEAEKHYKRLAEDMPAFICTFLPDSTLTYVNPAYCEIFQKHTDDLVGQKFLDFLPNEADRENVRRQYMSLTPENPVKTYEHDVIISDVTNQYHWHRWTDRAFFKDNGEIDHFQSIGQDITDRKQADEQLRLKTENLEEVNTALKVLLRQLEESKMELIGTMLSNIRELVLPHIHKLKDSSPSAHHISLLNIVETNLDNIASSFLHQLKFKYYNLTPREIEVATLVKEGRSIKEIGALLNISISTVQFHRISLREKLGLKDRKNNLRSYLLSLH